MHHGSLYYHCVYVYMIKTAVNWRQNGQASPPIRENNANLARHSLCPCIAGVFFIDASMYTTLVVVVEFLYSSGKKDSLDLEGRVRTAKVR
jgi:hypothetical protein